MDTSEEVDILAELDVLIRTHGPIGPGRYVGYLSRNNGSDSVLGASIDEVHAKLTDLAICKREMTSLKELVYVVEDMSKVKVPEWTDIPDGLVDACSQAKSLLEPWLVTINARMDELNSEMNALTGLPPTPQTQS